MSGQGPRAPLDHGKGEAGGVFAVRFSTEVCFRQIKGMVLPSLSSKTLSPVRTNASRKPCPSTLYQGRVIPCYEYRVPRMLVFRVLMSEILMTLDLLSTSGKSLVHH